MLGRFAAATTGEWATGSAWFRCCAARSSSTCEAACARQCGPGGTPVPAPHVSVRPSTRAQTPRTLRADPAWAPRPSRQFQPGCVVCTRLVELESQPGEELFALRELQTPDPQRHVQCAQSHEPFRFAHEHQLPAFWPASEYPGSTRDPVERTGHFLKSRKLITVLVS